MYRGVLQSVVLCCSVLQCVAVCCSVLQCVAVCCSVKGTPQSGVVCKCPDVCVCMRKCVCLIYVCTSLYEHLCTYMYVRVCIHTHMQITRSNVLMYLQVFANICIRICMWVYTYRHICTYMK